MARNWKDCQWPARVLFVVLLPLLRFVAGVRFVAGGAEADVLVEAVVC